MVFSGDVAKLKAGFHWAATLEGWSLSRNPTLGEVEGVLTARVIKVDEYWSTARPMNLAIWMGRTWWLWDNVVVSTDSIVVGSTITVRTKGDPTANTDVGIR